VCILCNMYTKFCERIIFVCHAGRLISLNFSCHLVMSGICPHHWVSDGPSLRYSKFKVKEKWHPSENTDLLRWKFNKLTGYVWNWFSLLLVRIKVVLLDISLIRGDKKWYSFELEVRFHIHHLETFSQLSCNYILYYSLQFVLTSLHKGCTLHLLKDLREQKLYAKLVQILILRIVFLSYSLWNITSNETFSVLKSFIVLCSLVLINLNSCQHIINWRCDELCILFL